MNESMAVCVIKRAFVFLLISEVVMVVVAAPMEHDSKIHGLINSGTHSNSHIDTQQMEDRTTGDFMTLPDDVIIDALFTNLDSVQDRLEVCEEKLRQQLLDPEDEDDDEEDAENIYGGENSFDDKENVSVTENEVDDDDDGLRLLGHRSESKKDKERAPTNTSGDIVGAGHEHTEYTADHLTRHMHRSKVMITHHEDKHHYTNQLEEQWQQEHQPKQQKRPQPSPKQPQLRQQPEQQKPQQQQQKQHDQQKPQQQHQKQHDQQKPQQQHQKRHDQQKPQQQHNQQQQHQEQLSEEPSPQKQLQQRDDKPNKIYTRTLRRRRQANLEGGDYEREPTNQIMITHKEKLKHQQQYRKTKIHQNTTQHQQQQHRHLQEMTATELVVNRLSGRLEYLRESLIECRGLHKSIKGLK